MAEQSSDPRWVAAANWAAAGGFGVGAIAQREGVSRIDALLAIADEWARSPHLFTVPSAAVRPFAAEQCPACGLWFASVDNHVAAHGRISGRRRGVAGTHTRWDHADAPRRSRRAADGLLHDDGDRVQCHVCGLWLAMLSPHLGVHGTTAVRYRARFALADGDPLVSRSMLRQRPRAPRRSRVDSPVVPAADVAPGRTAPRMPPRPPAPEHVGRRP